eukprot:scaffold415_cov124-Isochrysis_galbana.AAC.2
MWRRRAYAERRVAPAAGARACSISTGGKAPPTQVDGSARLSPTKCWSWFCRAALAGGVVPSYPP